MLMMKPLLKMYCDNSTEELGSQTRDRFAAKREREREREQSHQQLLPTELMRVIIWDLQQMTLLKALRI